MSNRMTEGNTPSPDEDRELIRWVTQTLADARAGQLDLRDLGQAMNGKWDQDFPAYMLTRLESLLSDRAKLEERVRETNDAVMEAAKGGGVACQTRIFMAIKPLMDALNRSTDRAT